MLVEHDDTVWITSLSAKRRLDCPKRFKPCKAPDSRGGWTFPEGQVVFCPSWKESALLLTNT
jgi:hypothetical protein